MSKLADAVKATLPLKGLARMESKDGSGPEGPAA
jgi:hypothetical protein